MGVEPRPGSIRADGTADLERIELALGELTAQQADILERMDRLVQLNEQMWDHHLQFCGRLIDKVTQTEKELLAAQTELGSQLDALRGQVPETG